VRENRTINSACTGKLTSLALGLLSVSLLAAATARAQSGQAAASNVPEPRGTGIVYYLDPANNLVPLEYRPVERQNIMLQVHGDHSSVRFPAGTPFRFLVRVPPDGAPGLVELDSVPGFRTIPLAYAGHGKYVLTKGGKVAAIIPVTSANANTDSVIATPQSPLQSGEFCFGVDESNGSSSATQAASTPPGKAAMTNADVIKLVAAGLSSDVIVGTIRQSASKSFDMSIDGLIALKKATVPDAVISAMQQSAAPALTTSQSASQSIPDSRIPEPGDIGVFYYVNAAGSLVRLEPTKVQITHEHQDMFEGNQVEYKLYGAKAPVRTADGMVALVVKVSPKSKGFHLLGNYDTTDIRSLTYRRWESVEGARETRIGAKPQRRGEERTPDPGEFAYTTFKLDDAFYKIAPVDPLTPGEYCISLTLPTDVEPIYCFGVDPAR
jgi:hypothetical protein